MTECLVGARAEMTSSNQVVEDASVVESITIELCIGLHGVTVVSLLGDEWDWVDNDVATQGAEEWYSGLPEHDKPIQGAYSINCRVSLDEESGVLVYEVLSSGSLNPRHWDESWCDHEQRTPTAADYYELQKQHDQLKTALFNAQKQLSELTTRS